MNAESKQIRRQLGFSLIEAMRAQSARHPLPATSQRISGEPTRIVLDNQVCLPCMVIQSS